VKSSEFFDRPWPIVALRTGAIFAVVRVLFGLAFIVLMSVSSESAIAIALVDFPTTALIIAVDHFAAIGRIDATDLKYFLLGAAAWFCTGWILGVLLTRMMKPRNA
jgi:hypothetical protein